MTDQHEKALRELIALAAKSSPMPWAIDPDNRPDMEWNNFIVQAARPHMRVCFMAHSGREDNSKQEHAAEFIAKASQAIESLTALLDELERKNKAIQSVFAVGCDECRHDAETNTITRLCFSCEDKRIAALNNLRRELKGE